MKKVLLLIAGLLSGCANWSPLVVGEESTYMVLHAYDGYQTAQFRHTPGVIEVESAWAIGQKPTAEDTAVFMASVAVMHFALTSILCATSPPWVVQAWEAGSIGWATRNVVGNYQLGVR